MSAANEGEVFALKRLVVGDHERLRKARREIDAMARVSGHRNVVRLVDSQLPTAVAKAGADEAYVLMELCGGERVVETLARGPLSSGAAMRIFCNVLEAVAHMHRLEPPLAHRDIKAENVLMCASGPDSGQYKLRRVAPFLPGPSCRARCVFATHLLVLPRGPPPSLARTKHRTHHHVPPPGAPRSDFGSATDRTFDPAQASYSDIVMWQEDIDQNTTLSYRAPEQVDVFQKRPVDERVDVWVRPLAAAAAAAVQRRHPR